MKCRRCNKILYKVRNYVLHHICNPVIDIRPGCINKITETDVSREGNKDVFLISEKRDIVHK